MTYIARNKIEPLCRHISSNFNRQLAIPTNWDIDQAIPYPRPLDKSSRPPQDFLDWIDLRVATNTSEGLFAAGERKRGTNRPVTVTREDLINLWRMNGGSNCRSFGIKGI